MKNGSSLVPYKKSAFSRASLFNEKDCFQLGISLHFLALVVLYGFRINNLKFHNLYYPTQQLEAGKAKHISDQYDLKAFLARALPNSLMEDESLRSMDSSKSFYHYKTDCAIVIRQFYTSILTCHPHKAHNRV